MSDQTEITVATHGVRLDNLENYVERIANSVDSLKGIIYKLVGAFIVVSFILQAAAVAAGFYLR